MWVYIDFENYLINQKHQEDTVIFYLTDLINIWVSECTTPAITGKFRALNPLFDMTDHVIMTRVQNLYKPGKGIVHQVEKISGSLKLLSTDAANRFSMKMELIFIPSGPETLFLELHQHVFSTMNELIIREKELIDVIKAKDAEIEEYRLEGVEIKRRAAITTPFNYEEFQNSQKKSEPVPNPSSLFNGPLGELLGRHTEVSVKSENKEEETEEPVKRKIAKPGPGKFPVFESRGCLYKKEDEEASDSKKRMKKYLKL